MDNAVGMRIMLADGSVYYVSSLSDDDVVSNDATTTASTTNMTFSLTQLPITRRFVLRIVWCRWW